MLALVAKREMSIGIFDSGFGGLSILSGFVTALPEYDYIYLGDTARAPYGGRSSSVVHRFTQQAVEFLFRQNCQLVILACNTASSDALHRIQTDYLPRHYPDRRVLGVLIPAAEAAVAASRDNVGVLATEGTVNSLAFVEELEKLAPHLRVKQQAAPLLAPLVEAGEHHSAAAGMILEQYLSPLAKARIDSLILGCTHYNHLAEAIAAFLGPKVKLINEAQVVPPKLADYLTRHPEIESRLTRHRKRSFYTTDLSQRFTTLGSQFYGQPINAVQVELDESP